MRLLTGIVNNPSIHLDKILLWQNSFLKVTPDAKVILVVVNATESDKKLLEKNNVEYHAIVSNSGETVNNLRLLPMSNFIGETPLQGITEVIYTDVFDVVFLKDPFAKLPKFRYGYGDCIVGSEGILHSEEPWNMDVMNKCFPSYSDLVRPKPILCSGVIAGTPADVSRILEKMFDLTHTSLKGHNIEDQAALNIVHYREQVFSGIRVMDLPDKWVLHMATGGPTEFFEKWGFKQTLERRYGFIPNWKEFDIVHQFNRIPEIHQEIKEMYE